jgi:hypothetical protein
MKLDIPAVWDYDFDPDNYYVGVNGITKKDLKAFISDFKLQDFFLGQWSNEKCPHMGTRLFNDLPNNRIYRAPLKNEPYLYPIHFSFLIEWYAVEYANDYFTLMDHVLDDLRNNRCKIFIHTSWEAPTMPRVAMFIDKVIEKYNLRKNQFVVFSNNINMMIDENANNDLSVLNTNSNYSGIHTICHSMFQTVGTKNTGSNCAYDDIKFEVELYSSIDNIKRFTPRPYKFICLNRRPKWHRWISAAYLFEDKKNGLLSFTLDFGNYNPTGNFIKDDYQTHYRNIIKEMMVSSDNNECNTSFNNIKKMCMLEISKIPEYSMMRTPLQNMLIDTSDVLNSDEFFNELPLLIDDGVDSRSNPVADGNNLKFLESYLHIVTETECFETDKYWFTEKIFKPIWCMQPFVIVGFQDSLKYLKSLGYKTFDNWIDESYDDIVNPFDRCMAALHSARQFYNRPDIEILKDYNDMLKTLKYNRNKIKFNCNKIHGNVRVDIMNSLSDLYWKPF